MHPQIKSIFLFCEEMILLEFYNNNKIPKLSCSPSISYPLKTSASSTSSELNMSYDNELNRQAACKLHEYVLSTQNI